jgi:hypothetical protein
LQRNKRRELIKQFIPGGFSGTVFSIHVLELPKKLFCFQNTAVFTAA